MCSNYTFLIYCRTSMARPLVARWNCFLGPSRSFCIEINHGRLELPLTGTNFYGPKSVSTVRRYFEITLFVILRADCMFLIVTDFMYSQLSLSRLRLSRITAYLEEKIWSLL